VNEFEEMLQIEQERAKETQGERSDLSETSRSNEREVKDSYEDAAEPFDVSASSLKRGKKVKDKAESDDEPEAVREAAQEAWDGLQSGDESFNSAYEKVTQSEREVEEKQQKEQRETEREQSFESSRSVVETFHGDFRDILQEYDGAIDHFVTDPPYDEDAIELWDALGKVAADHLQDGGFLIAYSGKAHLPDIHNVLTDHLKYYWQGIVRHNGPGAKIFSRKLRTGYKPVLIYQKGGLTAQEEFVSDVIEGTGREKDDHEWQQAEGEAAELLERFTAVNDVVCDPMCGSGTIGVACLRLQRRAVLIEKDEDTIHTAREKVKDHE
jgi:16S rRNA G966 N2-methylase RsmD